MCTVFVFKKYIFNTFGCLVTGRLVNADHTTLALASTLSIFMMLLAIFICILVLCK